MLNSSTMKLSNWTELKLERVATILSNGIQTAPKVCVACGKESVHNSYAFEKASVDECQACESIVLPEKRAGAFLNYFLPHYPVFIRKNEELGKKISALLPECYDKHYNAHRKIKIKEASPLIEVLAEDFRRVFEKSATFSFVFATRPILDTQNGIVNEQYRNTINSEAFKIIMTLILIFASVGGFIWGLIALLTKLTH